ncbi:hypothetical protein LXL04_036924 [Taraxacum kok-saghyz]
MNYTRKREHVGTSSSTPSTATMVAATGGRGWPEVVVFVHLDLQPLKIGNKLVAESEGLIGDEDGLVAGGRGGARVVKAQGGGRHLGLGFEWELLHEEEGAHPPLKSIIFYSTSIKNIQEQIKNIKNTQEHEEHSRTQLHLERISLTYTMLKEEKRFGLHRDAKWDA